MEDALLWHRLQFAFTITYHYLFPQLTMGLAWFLVYWKWRALRTGDEKYNRAARFWAKIFGLNFAVGVVTGIPMEFQFGTNWAGFSKYGGGVIGQTLAMEGMFAFFLESAFIGALIWGEKRLGPRYHFLAAVAVALGSWLSGYFRRVGVFVGLRAKTPSPSLTLRGRVCLSRSTNSALVPRSSNTLAFWAKATAGSTSSVQGSACQHARFRR